MRITADGLTTCGSPSTADPAALQEIAAERNAGASDRVRAAARRVSTFPNLASLRIAHRSLLESWLDGGDGPPANTPSTGESRREEDGAEVLVALGAVEHSLATATGDTYFLVRALEHTLWASELAPQSLVALFNRGLIESDLGLCRSAAATWSAYLQADPGSPWAREAEERSARLPCRQSIGLALNRNDRLFDEATETVLPAWADAEDPQTAAYQLQRLDEIADALFASAGDRFVLHLAAEIRAHDTPEYRAAVRNYVRGRAAWRDLEGSLDDVSEAINAARNTLEQIDSVLLPWCDVWLAGVATELEAEDPAARLAAHFGRPPASRSPRLLGQLHWASGWSAQRGGRLEDAYNHFVAAEKAFEAGDYHRSTASVQTLEAETLKDIGLVRESWRVRIDAIRFLQSVETSIALHNGLLDAAWAARISEETRATRAFFDELFHVDQDSGDPLSIIEGLIHIAGERSATGKTDEAAELLREALRLTREEPLGKPPTRLIAEASLALLGANVEPPPAGTMALPEIVGFFEDNGPPAMLMQSRRVEALRYLDAGDANTALARLGNAIRAALEIDAGITDADLGLNFRESVQALFDQAIALSSDGGASAQGLRLMETARNFGEPEPQLDPVSQIVFGDPPAESSADPGSDPIILSFGVLPDRIVWWRIDGGRGTAGSIAASEDPGERGSQDDSTCDARCTLDIAARVVTRSSAGFAASPRDLERLYDNLLAGAIDETDIGRTLILVPDGPLLQVPFAALITPRGNYLIEEHALSFRSSVTAALSGPRGTRRVERDAWKIAVVGNPTFDRDALPDLPELPGAEEEASVVTRLYGERALPLLGESATFARVRQAMEGRQVLHIAAHALSNGAAFGDTIVLAADASSGESGLTEAARLFDDIDTVPELVILSACSTLGTRPSRTGGLAGLARGAVVHGVSATVGTLWPVEDGLLLDIMPAFHAALLSGAAADEALRSAQRSAVTRGVRCCNWAALQLIGNLPASDQQPG